MSFISTKASRNNDVMQPKRSNKASLVEMKIDVVPIPQGASLESPLQKRQAQSVAIRQIQTLGRDLFEPNKTIVSARDNKKLYQTADLYSESISLEKLIPLLTASDLTLRLNAVRLGHSSSTTCMELKTGQLANLIENVSVDERNEKTCAVNIETSAELGCMFVGVKVKRGQHFISKLDYEVPEVHDSKMHV